MLSPHRMRGKMKWVRNSNPILDERARELRAQATLAEAQLWEALRAGRLDRLKFRRQHGVGRFILDFYCASKRLCIEVDGAVHDTQQERDAARDAALRVRGVRTLRFTNAQVLQALPEVLAAIRSATGTAPSDTPPPQLGQGSLGSREERAAHRAGERAPAGARNPDGTSVADDMARG